MGRGRAIDDIAKLLKRGLLVVALILQGYLSQVHIHNSTLPDSTAAIEFAAGGDGGRSPAQPLDGKGHDLHCFICHLAGVGSASLLPQATSFAPAPQWAIAYGVADDAFSLRNRYAAYSSRAPPHPFVQA